MFLLYDESNGPETGGEFCYTCSFYFSLVGVEGSIEMKVNPIQYFSYN